CPDESEQGNQGEQHQSLPDVRDGWHESQMFRRHLHKVFLLSHFLVVERRALCAPLTRKRYPLLAAGHIGHAPYVGRAGPLSWPSTLEPEAERRAWPPTGLCSWLIRAAHKMARNKGRERPYPYRPVPSGEQVPHSPAVPGGRAQSQR